MIVARFALLDWLLIGLYALSLLALGFWRRRRGEADDFLVAGRRVTLPAFVATLVATWYGGILGVGEFSYTQGVATWLALGGFYYLFAAIYAAFLAGRIAGRDRADLSIPDALGRAYGRPMALVGAVGTFLMVSPAPYVLMTGTLLALMTGVRADVCTVAGALFSMAYLWRGGFRSVVRTDLLQFALMFGGFGILLPLSVVHYGGFAFLQSHLPPEHLRPMGTMTVQALLVWGFIAVWTLVDPGFYQRCAAAESPRTARLGIVLSIGCWVVFDFLTCATGLYARAALPDLAVPSMAYPALAEAVLPSGLKALFYIGMLATVTSTVNSYAFIAALTVGRDGRRLLMGPTHHDEAAEVRATRLGLVVTFVYSVAVAFLTRSVVSIWYTLGTVAIPALLLPLVTALVGRGRIVPRLALVSTFGAAAISTGWLLWGYGHLADGFPGYPLAVEPMYPGLAWSVLIFSLGQLRRAPGERVP